MIKLYQESKERNENRNQNSQPQQYEDGGEEFINQQEEDEKAIEEANLESLNEGFQQRNDNQSSNELSPVNNDFEDIINNTLDMNDFIDDSNPQKNQNEVENNDSNPQQNNDLIIQTQYLNDFKNMNLNAKPDEKKDNNLIPNNFMHDKTNLIIINVFIIIVILVFKVTKFIL